MLQVQMSPASHCSTGVSESCQGAPIRPGRSQWSRPQSSYPVIMWTVHSMISTTPRSPSSPCSPGPQHPSSAHSTPHLRGNIRPLLIFLLILCLPTITTSRWADRGYLNCGPGMVATLPLVNVVGVKLYKEGVNALTLVLSGSTT